MDKQISRRKVLGRLALGALGTLGTLASLVLPGSVYPGSAYSASPQTSIEYSTIINRPVKQAGIQIVNAEFGLEKKLWEDLPKEMNKQELYNAIKDASMRSTTTTILSGFPIIHPGPINHEDLLEKLQKGAKTYITNGSPKLDLDLEFTRKDKKVFDALLEKSLTSCMTGTIDPIIGWDREVYIYPPQSKIILTRGREKSSINIMVNTNPKIEPVKYKSMPVIDVMGKEQEVFERFLKFSILTDDKEVEVYYKGQAKKQGRVIKAPIDAMHMIYEDR